MRPTGRPAAPFDAVLLDAPCSATGTIRRHPDVPHLKRPRDVRALAEAQDRLLAAAAAMLRPGGRLIYCGLLAAARGRRAARVGRLAAAVCGTIRSRAAELAALPEALDRGGLPAHAARPVAGTRRHGRVLRRAPDQTGPDARLAAVLVRQRRPV